jgi:hypothetical protein
MTGRTRPEGYPVVEAPKPKHPSTSILIALSVILGIVISAGTIFGVLGDAFFVGRVEYNIKNLQDAETTTTFRQTLSQIDRTLAAQDKSFKDLAASVDAIRLDAARRR